MLLVGTGETSERITQDVNANQEFGVVIRAYIGEASPSFEHGVVPVYQSFAEISHHPKLSKVERIVVALDDRRGTIV